MEINWDSLNSVQRLAIRGIISGAPTMYRIGFDTEGVHIKSGLSTDGTNPVIVECSFMGINGFINRGDETLIDLTPPVKG